MGSHPMSQSARSFLQSEAGSVVQQRKQFCIQTKPSLLPPQLTSRASDVTSAKYRSFAYLVQEHFVQFLFGQGEAFAVSAVHDQDDDLKKKKKKLRKSPRCQNSITYYHANNAHLLSVTTDKREHASISSIDDYATVILSTQAAALNNKKSIRVNVCWLINLWNPFCFSSCNSKNLL